MSRFIAILGLTQDSMSFFEAELIVDILLHSSHSLQNPSLLRIPDTPIKLLLLRMDVGHRGLEITMTRKT